MDMDEFSSLFEECVEVPLRQQGFERYKKTKSLILTKGDIQLSLIRLGGEGRKRVASRRHSAFGTLFCA